MLTQAKLESVESLAKKQAQVNKDNAAKQSREERPPEIRIRNVHKDGKVELFFTQPIVNFPDDFAEQVNAYN